MIKIWKGERREDERGGERRGRGEKRGKEKRGEETRGSHDLAGFQQPGDQVIMFVDNSSLGLWQNN